jgi:hypothetical integral membrane protein (TIGR02206 family)
MFFSNKIGIDLVFMGPWHLLQIAITAIVIFLIVYFKEDIRKSKYERFFRYSLAFFMISLEVGYHIWQAVNGTWTLIHNLPFDLCTITMYLAAITIVTKNRTLFNISFFWAFGGILSVLFPEIPYGPDRYRYFHFFLIHMTFIWAFIYMIFVYDYRPTLKQFFISCGLLFIISVGFMLPFDLLVKENFMFMVNPGGTPLYLIHSYGAFIYTVGVIGIMLIIALSWYLPIYIYLRKTKKI